MKTFPRCSSRVDLVVVLWALAGCGGDSGGPITPKSLAITGCHCRDRRDRGVHAHDRTAHRGDRDRTLDISLGANSADRRAGRTQVDGESAAVVASSWRIT